MKRIKIKITSRTKDTPELRKEIYKKALAIIKRDYKKFGYYNLGICRAIENITDGRNNHYRFSFYSQDNVFVELAAWKPINSSHKDYWFPLDAEGTSKRIAILEEIISKM